ncbi:hypothetical protein M413DRAFT_156254 [Hebeloma cylindrosporum]|uniref:F-box domain-containing protein n=1 Tax=Hebeloma cylindrosporum TaxID=76867 RepID=A0A0C3BWE3_HEBCY|nr:hypothetical protein M413DRAFT_156254 [Hebeloma cylindrosporum h7]
MPAPIPQEIIDSCIDNLAFDVRDSDKSCKARKALLLCSLVSRAFGQRARHHIFSDICIRPSRGDGRSQKLRDIMKKDPNLCRFIRTLDIHIADKGPQKTATSRTGLPDILNMLSRSSGGRGIEGFTLHGNSNRNPWGRIDKEFLSALVNLIYNADSDEGSSSGHFRTLKFIQISGFKEVPTALITNCPSTIKSMRILYLSFVEDAKAQPSTLKKKHKFHFTGIARGNVDSLATSLLGEPLLFSQLEELDSYPQCAEDLAFVHRVINSAAKSLKMFKLEARSDRNVEYPGGIDLSLLPNLRVVKIFSNST